MGLIRYNADLPHQAAATRSVSDLLEGLSRAQASFALGEEIVPNAAEWDDLADDWLAENLHRVQAEHNHLHPEAPVPLHRLRPDDGAMLEGVSVDAHSAPHFTVEMETGTGKTYVYLRTMLELHRRFGLTKFIIVVPSVAILEGVKKTFEDTREHFNTVFSVTNFSLVIYDGAQLPRIRTFCQSQFPTLMVMTQQSFNRSSNNLYKATEKLAGERRPFEWVQLTRPVVVLDEPQNMGSERSKEAIRTLKPLFVLRYSATHKDDDRPNPIYRLTPVQAFRLGLVKQVQVVGITDLGFPATTGLQLLGVSRDPIRAKVKALCLLPGGVTEPRTLLLKQGDELFKQSHLPEHRGLRVENIRVESGGAPGQVVLSGGQDGERCLSTGDELPAAREETWGAQIEETIRAHFARQRELRPRGIKVLSLFFLDRVANYQGEAPKVRALFEAAFDRLKQSEPHFCSLEAREVHQGYFAKAKKKGRGASQTEEEYLDEVKTDSEEARLAYEAIMRAKDRLLTFPDGQDPIKRVSFIFAHSALKEGWDNPNVFQICTLNQTTSLMKKRQEIGRGLRLCVDQQGHRPDDPSINVLTVIANESYESYVKTLQTEYREGGEQAPPAPTRPGKSKATRRDELLKLDLFARFWASLRQRLDYSIDVDTDKLIQACGDRLNSATFPKAMLTLSRGRFIVVEYTLQVVKAVPGDRVQLLIREQSSQPDEVHLGLVPPSDLFCNVGVGDELARLTKNPHLVGFKVMEIAHHLGEWRLRFANEVVVSESELHHFTANQIDKNPVREQLITQGEHPIPDFIGRAADETLLTRSTLWRIFDAIREEQKATLHAHPEGWANTFVREVRDALKDHIVDRLRFRDTGRLADNIGDLEEVFPPTDELVQRELIPGGKRSLYDKVQVDSDVERRFVNEHLIPDEQNLVVYFKFPPRFRIDLPKVIGNYNPDWGILRQDQDRRLTLELVRETKGSDDLDKLRFQHEGQKLILAQRYFAQLGIDYRFFSPDVERYWESDQAASQRRRGPQRVFRTPPAANMVMVPIYDLRAAAGAFSAGQAPSPLGRYPLTSRKASRAGAFLARLSGSSMNKVAPDGAWCLWQNLRAEGVAPAEPGELLLVRMADPHDPGLGGFTFKRWALDRHGERLEPASRLPHYAPIPLRREEEVEFIARFVEAVNVDEREILE